MKGRSRWVIFGWGILFGLGLFACSPDDGCTNGEEKACTCEGGLNGTQTCADGAWGTCGCDCQPACDGKNCGPDGCGGQCGDCDQPPTSSCIDTTTEQYHDATGTCQDGTCSYTAHQRTCTLGCQGDSCLADPCDALDCDQPPNACHQATGQCVREPEAHCEYTALDDGTACNDGLYCNGAETCQLGECQSGAAIDCSDQANACNTASCDEETQACVAAPVADQTPCNDGIYCNGTEVCLSGECQAGQALDCSHLDDTCKAGDCSEPLKKCVARSLPNDTSCSDGVICNGDEVCRSGECMPGKPLVCAQPFNQCLYTECVESKGGCEEKTRADNTDCDDINPCTLGETCIAGECTPDSVAADYTACDDHNPCTVDEYCLDADCVPDSQICDGSVVIMMYMDADNNLDDFLTSDWHEMEAADVEDIPWMRVFVLIDHSGVGDSHFYEVQNGHSKEMNAPTLGLTTDGNQELNMGDGATVTGFIQDVKSIVGSEASFFLMLSDHGRLAWTDQTQAPPDPRRVLRRPQQQRLHFHPGIAHRRFRTGSAIHRF